KEATAPESAHIVDARHSDAARLPRELRAIPAPLRKSPFRGGGETDDREGELLPAAGEHHSVVTLEPVGTDAYALALVGLHAQPCLHRVQAGREGRQLPAGRLDTIDLHLRQDIVMQGRVSH